MNDVPIPVAAHLLQDWMWQRLGPVLPFKSRRIARSSGRVQFHQRILDQLSNMVRVPGSLLMMADQERCLREDIARAARTAKHTALYNPHRIWIEGVQYGIDWRKVDDLA